MNLQDSRVWMAETRPADLSDDDYLFPMLTTTRAHAHTPGDSSDVDSLKGVR